MDRGGDSQEEDCYIHEGIAYDHGVWRDYISDLWDY